ncbi:TraB/GumN family protein [Yoonia sp.]|uniref:TraB/GumN family protein n=1 Tax=Yoonia sp. TaxID=2212373 RepID=UPI0019DB01C2|nr:TraB/GumN family protein [Yoonia sp.]MBE0413644.1 TraB/GumN family protein [Yoonia sp.]
MNLRRALIALFALVGFPAAAECTDTSYVDRLSPGQTSALAAAVADMPYAQGLIWRARKGDQIITLAGTMHVYDPRLEPIRDQLRPDVTTADLILLEATPAEERQLQDLMTTQPDVLFITDGPTLPELLDEPTWQLIADAVRDRNIPAFLAAKMQPWYLSMVLSIPACLSNDMMAGNLGLDAMIIEDAMAADVPMQALEPYTTLFDIFQNDPIDEQIAMLRVALGAPDLQDEIFVATLDSYFARDVGRLWELSRIAIADVPGLTQAEATRLFAESEKALLIDRNLAWIPVIDAALAQHDNIVVAVGAAHLVGAYGLPQLLENDGWALTRLD